MSTTLSDIPKGASRIEELSGIINSPGQPNHGKAASLELHQDYVGGTLTQWLVVRVEGEKLGAYNRSAWVKRASGRNISKLRLLLDAMKAEIVERATCLECGKYMNAHASFCSNANAPEVK